MKKPANADISNLFRNFGGDTGSYKEIQQEYVDEKAQQSWPIVAAMEKARASAPVLKVAAPRQSGSLGAKTGSFAAHSAPVNQGARSSVGNSTGSFVAPSSAVREAAIVPQAGSKAGTSFSIFAQPVPEPMVHSNPVNSLFAMPKAAPVPEPVIQSNTVSSLFATAKPNVEPKMVAQPVVNSLFGAMAAPLAEQVKVVSPPVMTQPVQQARSENDPLNSVFSRLLNPHGEVAANVPDNNLRGLLGFLKK